MPHPPRITRRRDRITPLIAGLVAFIALPFIAACSSTEEALPEIAPGPTFQGPRFLRGTVASYATLTNTRPLLVSGYGLMVGLHDTGSSEVPAFLRDWLLREMARQGVGQTLSRDVLPGSPQQILARSDTAVVEVVGLIPAGAVRGTRFDLLVFPADSQTTSLNAGKLWTAQLAVNGSRNPTRFLEPLARASGPVYLDPIPPELGPNQTHDERAAVIVNGGVATAPRTVEIRLNQPSWRIARVISDRINERFPRDPLEKLDTAVPRSAVLVQLNIPERFQSDPERFLNLVQYLYTQRSPNFITQQARALLELLGDPQHRDAFLAETTFALQALGPNAIPILKDYYSITTPVPVRLAALRSGALLGDEDAIPVLTQFAQDADPDTRAAAARPLADLPSTFERNQAMRRLLGDDDQAVRIAAYEALALNNDPMIERFAVRNPQTNQIKYLIDLVPTPEPLIHVTPQRVPRIAFFNRNIPLTENRLGQAFENRLMVRAGLMAVAHQNDADPNANGEPINDAEPADEPQKLPIADLFYQPPLRGDARRLQIGPTAVDLAYALGHAPTREDAQQGLGLSFSEVAAALKTLQAQGVIDAPIHVQTSPLAQTIYQARANEQDVQRAADDIDLSDIPTIGPPDSESAGTEPEVDTETDTEPTTEERFQPLENPTALPR
ncbi:MAG: flagellar basal body P-ring protein FlgI [Planctomycetota bacterium]